MCGSTNHRQERYKSQLSTLRHQRAATSNELDALFDVLQSERRRIVLDILFEVQEEEASDEVTVHARDLARQVAAIEAGVESTTIDQSTYRKATIGLHHTHLPMLGECGIIEYDEQTKKVSTTDRTQVAQVMQSIVDSVERSDSVLTLPAEREV